MAGLLPTVRGSAAALYPISRMNTCATSVQKFINGSEQRFKRAASLASFKLTYTGLFANDRDALKLFYAEQKGSFDSTWSFALDNTYPNCTFLEDGFSSVEGARPNLYDVSLQFRQTIPGGAVAGQGNFGYPVLTSGATAQRPYQQNQRWRTSKNDNPTGKRYAYEWYGAGLQGFPNRGLLSWRLQYPSITDADMAILEAFFVNMNGRWNSFNFVDPDGPGPEGIANYPDVRFDMDALEYRYLAKNQASTTILLIETGNPNNSLLPVNF
jgi:hypothetical protein